MNNEDNNFRNTFSGSYYTIGQFVIVPRNQSPIFRYDHFKIFMYRNVKFLSFPEVSQHAAFFTHYFNVCHISEDIRP